MCRAKQTRMLKIDWLGLESQCFAESDEQFQIFNFALPFRVEYGPRGLEES